VLSVRIEPAGIALQLEPGERLLDALDDLERVEVLAVSCRAANCARCLVRIHQGGDGLVPPDADETRLLQMLGASSDQRLGCQLRAAFEGSQAVVSVRLVAAGAR